MCYYQKEFKIKLSSNSSARDFHFHVIFISGHENYQTLSSSSLIPLFTSGLPVSVHGVWVLPLVKTSQKDGLGLFTFMHWRRKWQPTPVFLPGESQGLGSLVGCRLWGRTESDTTEAT